MPALRFAPLSTVVTAAVVMALGVVEESAVARDPTPGARPEERNHLLEASWKKVEVKVEKRGGKDVAAAVKLVAPQVRLFHAGSDAPEPHANGQKAEGKKKQRAAEVIDLAQELRKVTPLDVDHIDILDGEVAFIDTSRVERPELWLHDLQLSVENLVTRLHLADGRPALLTATGTVARSGKMTIFVTAEPFEKGLTFSGRAAVVGLQTAELYRFIEPATKMHAPEGTVDIFVEFDCRNGVLTGGVKPVMKNVKVRPANKSPFTVIKAWAADVAVKIFSDRVEPRNAVATVVPIKGDLTGPDVQLWPTIMGVLRNAFVEGLTAGYAHLPPPTSEAPPPKPPAPEPNAPVPTP
jgi:hypothetical protein